MIIGKVPRVCEHCHQTVMTHSGGMRWCPQCRDKCYTAEQRKYQARYKAQRRAERRAAA